MRIGVPKEIKNQEYRVGIVPAGVHAFVSHGHEVLIEAGAGKGSGIEDADFVAAGARIVPDAATVYGEAEMIVKVKEPIPPEYPMLREGQLLYAYLHLAPAPELTAALMSSGCVAVAFRDSAASRWVTTPAGPDERGRRPPCDTGRGPVVGESEGWAGTASRWGPWHRAGQGGDRGRRRGGHKRGQDGDRPERARHDRRHESPPTAVPGRCLSRPGTVPWPPRNTPCAKRSPTPTWWWGQCSSPAPAPLTSSPATCSVPCRKRSVIVDVAVDQGGCVETTRATTHDDPTFVVDGVTHYCVANMPGCVARTSTSALANATLPYGLRLADLGYRQALLSDPALLKGLNVIDGEWYRPVAEALGHERFLAEELCASRLSYRSAASRAWRRRSTR